MRAELTNSTSEVSLVILIHYYDYCNRHNSEQTERRAATATGDPSCETRQVVESSVSNSRQVLTMHFDKNMKIQSQKLLKKYYFHLKNLTE